MTDGTRIDDAAHPDRLDRPSETVPSVDAPWDDPRDRAHRMRAIRGDRSAHRVHHALFEDMLN